MKLSTKLVLSIVITSLAGLTAAFFVVNTFVRNAVYYNIIESTQHNMTIHANELNQWFENSMYITDTMAAAMSSLGREHITPIAHGVVERYPFIEMAFVGFEADGVFDSCSIRQTSEGWRLHTRPWYLQAVAAGGEAVFTSPYVSAASQNVGETPHTLVVSVVRYMPDWDGAVIGVDFVLDDVADIVAAADVPGGGYIFLLDESGYIVNHPDPSFAPTESYLRSINDFPVYAPLGDILHENMGITSFTDYNGAHSYMMAFRMTSTGWTMVSVMPATVATGPVWQTLSIVMLTFLLVMSAAFAFMLLYIPRLIGSAAKRINNRIKDFKEYTAAVAKGQPADERFNPNDAFYDTSFGLNRITTEFDANMRAILKLIRDMTNMHREQSLGNFKFLLEPGNYDGAYEEVARNHNELVEELAERLHIINENIEYASKIQMSLLPEAGEFEKAFSDYSIKWEPRDVVGGDILWIKNFESGTVLCVCDCTGHGVPGALLTMLIVSAFEDMVNESNCGDTARMIWNLEQRLTDIFGTLSEGTNVKQKDGCDLAVLFIAKDKSVTLSSCNTPVFICDGNEVTQIKGQHIFIGENRLKSKDEINVIQIPPSPGKKFYIASDGLYEQPGGEKKRMYGYKEFKRIILENHGRSQAVISEKVWEAYENYRGDLKRVDDFELVSFEL
ncbi:MAG: SpoIIE family protein phosphatase [Defluviitaleaceae bacterium]|nr:SpoIIE family protein phosphatase [Defluviitaleaceae bacterium]MCL2836923.1 SpoIIE family protein phosphatase [Defluviitaleaceae bacterium]